MNPVAMPVDAAPRAGSLAGRVVDCAALGADTRDAMLGLLASHFDGVDRAGFLDDLDSKNAAILLEDAQGVLRGFSTMRVFASRATGDTVVYSGDTIVDRDWWGSPALARTWVQAVRALARGATGDVWWFLITSGFRTYRFLPVFFREFHPRPDIRMPDETRVRRDAIGAELFGTRYDPERGIVRLARPQVLAGELIDVPAGRATDPYVHFFLDRNPGYVRGDELACLTQIHDDNLTPAGRRMTRAAGGLR